MRRNRLKTTIVAIGLVVALILAAVIQFLLPGEIEGGLKRIIFFMSVVIAYAVVVLISSKISHR